MAHRKLIWAASANMIFENIQHDMVHRGLIHYYSCTRRTDTFQLFLRTFLSFIQQSFNCFFLYALSQVVSIVTTVVLKVPRVCTDTQNKES